MEHFEIHPENPQERFIKKSSACLRDGGLIIYPTDTVYGLGCDLYNKKAVEKIYQIKGFKKRAYLSFICPDLKEIAQYARVSTPAYKIMKHLTPGPFTFILPAMRQVPKILLEKKKTVGIRVPDDKICQLLLADFGNPIISTSARLADQEYTNDIHEIMDIFEPHVDIFLDSGPGGLEPSTIIDLSTDDPLLIRKGKGPVHTVLVE